MQFGAAVCELPCKGYDLGDGEFGHGTRVREGRVEDGNAEGGGGDEIDLVCADTEAADHQ
jgi:hypothetical protein